MKKRILFISLVLILTSVIFFQIDNLIYLGNSDIINRLEGEIYYTKRVNGVLTLFKSDANLTNEQLIYSHKGKGEFTYDDYNDNIIDYYYDKNNKTINFIAMNDGDWSLFSLKAGEDTPIFIQKADFLPKTDYLKDTTDDNLSVKQKRGSIYLSKNGKERCILKFKGIYDAKFTGYSPIGLSPNGDYLVYHSMDHLTPTGTIIEGIINDTYGHTYIMELKTGKSTRFIDADHFQWIDN